MNLLFLDNVGGDGSDWHKLITSCMQPAYYMTWYLNVLASRSHGQNNTNADGHNIVNTL